MNPSVQVCNLCSETLTLIDDAHHIWLIFLKLVNSVYTFILTSILLDQLVIWHTSLMFYGLEVSWWMVHLITTTMYLLMRRFDNFFDISHKTTIPTVLCLFLWTHSTFHQAHDLRQHFRKWNIGADLAPSNIKARTRDFRSRKSFGLLDKQDVQVWQLQLSTVVAIHLSAVVPFLTELEYWLDIQMRN